MSCILGNLNSSSGSVTDFLGWPCDHLPVCKLRVCDQMASEASRSTDGLWPSPTERSEEKMGCAPRLNHVVFGVNRVWFVIQTGLLRRNNMWKALPSRVGTAWGQLSFTRTWKFSLFLTDLEGIWRRGKILCSLCIQWISHLIDVSLCCQYFCSWRFEGSFSKSLL